MNKPKQRHGRSSRVCIGAWRLLPYFTYCFGAFIIAVGQVHVGLSLSFKLSYRFVHHDSGTKDRFLPDSHLTPFSQAEVFSYCESS